MLKRVEQVIYDRGKDRAPTLDLHAHNRMYVHKQE